MQFNDTTKLNGLIQSCEFWTGLGQSQISGDTTKLKEFTRLININYHKTVTMIFQSMDEWDFDDPNHGDRGFIKTYDLVSGQEYVQLPVSDKILKVKRAEIKLDNVTWYRAWPIDVNEFGQATSETSNIANNFEKTRPFYDLQGQYVYIYPIPDTNVTGGLKLWISREIDEFSTSDTTQEPGIDEPFHEMIAIGASLDYSLAKGLSNAGNLAGKMADYEARLRQYYGSKQEDRQLVLKANYVDYN